MSAMVDRKEVLRRRIAYYRRRLAEGVDADLAREYLRQIVDSEHELQQLEADAERRG